MERVSPRSDTGYWHRRAVSSVSAGRDKFFRLSPDAKSFAVRRGDCHERIDVKFFVLGGHQYLTTETRSLGSLVVSEPEYGSGERAVPMASEADVKYIRITDFDDNGIPDDHEFVTAKVVDSRYSLQPGDIIFARSGATVGKTYLYTGDIGAAIFAGYCIRFRFNPALVLPEFVYIYTKTSRYQTWVKSIQRPSGQPNINKEEFKAFTIPLPSLDIQHALVAEMGIARESRRAKLNEADALLRSLDGWLLAQLGITIPPKSNHKVFAAHLGEAKGRVDVAFHSPRFRALREGIEHCKYPARTVGSLCVSIKSGFAAGKQDQAENDVDGVPHLRPLNLSIYGDLSLKGTKYVPRTSVAAQDFCQQGEVLFNNTNSEELVGKSAVFGLDVDCACSNHMTRLELTPEASPYFIAALFNALRSTGYLGMLATNFVNQAGINADTLAALRIPVPPLDIQQTILSEVARRRTEAQRLRAEAEAEWQAAKERFESQLLTGK
jgi:type I restriction enzyme, S subunit